MNGVCERSHAKWRLGVVSYLNAKPLIAGLDADPAVELVYHVPARLPALLDESVVGVALVPVIDLMHEGRAWRIVSDACIGCDGETLTVRVFSRTPAESVHRLHADGESHTSVTLATILWRELYGISLEIVPFVGTETILDGEAILLIGDKVVNNRLSGFEVEIDLGSAWKTLTSLPFVFAVWAARPGVEIAGLGQRLGSARDRGVAAAAAIARDFGPRMGWPVPLATDYLTKRLKFTLGSRQRRGMAKFLKLAKIHGLAPAAREFVFA